MEIAVTVSNSTTTDSATVRLQLYNPDRSALLNELDMPIAVPAGQTATATAAYQIPGDAALGIYHIDYLLLDAAGNAIQPQAESDSGRFVVSNPPANLQKSPDFNFAVNSDSEKYPRGSDATFTITMHNNTDLEKTITAKYYLPHHWWETRETQYGGDWNRRDLNLVKTITVPPRSSANFVHVVKNARASIDRLWAYFYDETGKQVGDSSRGFYVFTPSVTISSQTDKSSYAKGETVNLNLNVLNRQSAQSAVNLQVRVTDPTNLAVYTGSVTTTLAANGASTHNLSFALPDTAQGGFYTVSTEAFDALNNKIGGNSATFELPLSHVTVSPVLPLTLAAGTNTVSFNLSNAGKVAVQAGALNLSLKAPDGDIAVSLSHPFALAAGQSTTFAAPISIPTLKFGTYTFSFTQNDETRIGKAAAISLANTVHSTASFDKTSYRIRETAILAISLTNTGRFSLENVSVTVSAPDAGYTDTKNINIGQGQALPLQYAIPLPVTMTAGQHTVTVTLTLPGGASVANTVSFTVPQSSLALSLNQTAYVAGSIISPVLTNSGGVDTQAQYRISLYDTKSALIADKSLTETVQSNGALTVNLPVPVGATDGGYALVVTYTDQKTGQTDIVQKNLAITGVKAALTVQTAKPSYLSSESIVALSDIANSGTTLQGGNLHLQVSTAAGSQKQKTWTSQFDFQQGVRNGVDTYGVNDWLIPDDDFEGPEIDKNRWSTWGNVKIESGKLVVDSSEASSGVTSKWDMEGDFDIQIDFSNNNSVGKKGAELFLSGESFYVFIKNSAAYGYQSSINIMAAT